MFKDYDKYLSTSLKVYLFVLVIIFILKLVGLDYFGLDVNNNLFNVLNDFCLKHKVDYLYYFISLYLQLYFFLGIVCKKDKLFLYSLIGTILNCVVQIILMNYYKMDFIYYIFSTTITIVFPIIISKKFMIKRTILCIILITFYQYLSLFIRNISFNYQYGNFIIDSILNLDQLLLLAITYNITLMKGVNVKWVQEVGSFSLKKLNLKNLLTKLRKNYHNFKKQDRVTKLTYIIYFIFSLIWNTLSVIVILLVARLNDTFIECVFILTSFWLSKKSFGKAFHLSSMSKCFIVSNLSYYILNRITTPLGISIIVPILLGVGLSYVTSKLVKKTYKTLYRGMPEELFEETILKVVDKNSLKYKICYDFYIKNKSIISLAIKYNYTESGIRKIKDRVNEKIKRLN